MELDHFRWNMRYSNSNQWHQYCCLLLVSAQRSICSIYYVCIRPICECHTNHDDHFLALFCGDALTHPCRCQFILLTEEHPRRSLSEPWDEIELRFYSVLALIIRYIQTPDGISNADCIECSRSFESIWEKRCKNSSEMISSSATQLLNNCVAYKWEKF